MITALITLYVVIGLMWSSYRMTKVQDYITISDTKYIIILTPLWPGAVIYNLWTLFGKMPEVVIWKRK